MVLIFGISGTIIGIISLIFSHYGKKSYIEKKKRCTSSVEGKIIRFEIRKYRNYDDYDIVYYPVYEYFVNQKRCELMGSNGLSVYYGEKKEEKIDSLIGKTKNIFYNPLNCNESYISNENINIVYNIAKILGIVLLII